jgi:hypothetical protein
VASEHGPRKLGAILTADVVGNSRLVGADEERTLARLRALHSDLMDPTIAVQAPSHPLGWARRGVWKAALTSGRGGGSPRPERFVS